MSQVRFIADLHFGHENMAKFRGFASAFDQDEFIISQWNKVVNKKDLTYILGDITMESTKFYPLLGRLNGRKIIVAGNHDKPQHTRELLNWVESVTGLVKYKGVFLSHCPIHPRELEYRISHNIHGHIHSKYIEYDVKLFGIKLFSRVDRRYICVSGEHVNYTPKTLIELGINH
jgi:calcineurin-like phosphoesterase family protein